jgi:hypothetical protein
MEEEEGGVQSSFLLELKIKFAQKIDRRQKSKG